MNTRPLTISEENNLAAIKQSVGDYALIFLTATGLSKGIYDATLPIRTLFKEKGIHNFYLQGQGKEHKVYLTGIIAEDNTFSSVKVSLYRPKAKEGDPRLCPYGLTRFAEADQVLAVFIHEMRVHFLNITKSNISTDLADGRSTTLSEMLTQLNNETSNIAKELIERLREIALRGQLEAVCRGDTAIGRSIEAALGMKMNSRRTPDYKGIELKSYRATKPDNGLITLFSKTPDWKRGLVKDRSLGFLRRFGYFSEQKNRNQLYCSVYANKQNSLGFRLRLNESLSDLEEHHKSIPTQPVAVWALDTLHNCLRKKHAETFWIKAATEVRPDGREFFSINSVTHTCRPIIPQFDAFVIEGQICMDHTIYQDGSGAGDHGYLFRVKQEKLTDLFTGKPKIYGMS
jgi:MvaI/BcnI restriction endonuclease family